MGIPPLARLLSRPTRLFYGWRIVGLSGIANAIGGGIYFYGFSVFFLPVSRDLGLTRAETSLIFSLARAEGAVEGPFAGWLVDRFGPKWVLAGGAVIAGLGYIALSQATDFSSFLFIYLILISLAYNAGFAHSTLTAVNSWFVRRRGFAMAVTTSAYSVGGATISPVLALLVAHLGWRTAAVISGIALIVFVVPAALGLKRSPESMGLLPDGDEKPPSAEQARHAEAGEFTVREGLRTRAYWQLSVATMLRLAVGNVVAIQFVALMVWKGVDEVGGAFMLATMSALAIPSRIIIGYYGDHYPKNMMLSTGMLVGCAAYVLLLVADSPWQLWMVVAMLAVVEGVNSLNWAIIGDFYGRRSFATLRGMMGLIYTWGTAAAPVIAGAIYDTTQSYSVVLTIMTVSYFLGAILFFTLRPPALPKRVADLSAVDPVL